jgi:hypothetical protein
MYKMKKVVIYRLHIDLTKGVLYKVGRGGEGMRGEEKKFNLLFVP